MSKRYKIHPGIGIARVGKSTAGYFLASETIDGKPFELSSTGEKEFGGYKDAAFLIRRQGVRFRVFEYDVDDTTGAQTFVGEVTPDKAKVIWSVKLGSRKAAGPFMVPSVGPQSEKIIVPGSSLRNEDVDDRSRLVATASLPSILGENQPFKQLEGSVMGKTVLLGEVGTDHKGRLVVLGGHGEANSWKTPPPEIGDYLNNDGWFDDIADGPIDAELEFPDGSKQSVQDGAWVCVAPPDFAPLIEPFVSLYDLMFDALVRAGRLPHPQQVSFQHDIRPILERAASLRWVNPLSTWRDLFKKVENEGALKELADKSPSPAAQSKRQAAYDILLQSEDDLAGFRLTITQKEDLLDKWAVGTFESDLNSSPPSLNEAEKLDRAVLTRSVGSGLFPGIEMGYLATNHTLYSELGRFTRGEFDDFNGPSKLQPGSVTERMALPWQADFMECDRVWWPVQRPDIALFKADGSAAPPDFRWYRGLVVNSNAADPGSHLNMVRHFAKLGVIDQILTDSGKSVMAETGRSSDLDSL